jgi:hypothetical protein
VETYYEVSEFLYRWEHQSPKAQEAGLDTRDFSTLYTTLPHEKLFKALKHATREAFNYAAEKLEIKPEHLCIRPTKRKFCSWVRSTQKQNDVWTHEILMEHIRFLVSNTYVQAGKSLYRQIVGIPMGTNCAPALANLFLYYYESSYISRLVENQKFSEARHFRTTFRLIDDVLSVGNPQLHSALSVPAEEGGLYPRALELKQTSESNTEVEFIGIRIKQKRLRFHLSVYDKRKSFPFTVRRYPRMNSLIPKTIHYGVFTGLLYRGHRICSGARDFLSYATEVAQILRGNGCVKRRLKHTFKAFLYSVKGRNKYLLTNTEMIKCFCAELGNKG